MTSAGHWAFFHPCGRRGTLRTFGFGCHFAWQAQYLVKLQDVLEGSKVSLCETVVMFDLGHDDDSAWQVQHFG